MKQFWTVCAKIWENIFGETEFQKNFEEILAINFAEILKNYYLAN